MRLGSVAAAILVFGGSVRSQESTVDFVRDVRPIFREHCVSCLDRACEFSDDRFSLT